MKKVNFDTIDKMTAPEEWVNKALSIPEEQSKRKTHRIPFWQYSVAFAACLVAAAAVTVILFTLMSDKNPIVIKETVPVIVTPTLPTQEDGRIAEESQQPSKNTDYYTGDPDALIHQGDVQGADAARSPAFSQSVSSTQSETLHAAQPSTGTSDAPIVPAIAATEDATVTATEYPTEQAYIHTEPATQNATEPACINTESATQTATESDIVFVDTIERAFYVPEDDRIYCKITDFSGNILYGDEDLYSQQHLCTLVKRTKYQTFCSYSPKELGILPEKGSYFCTFYDDWGAVLLSEKVYLNN